MVYALINVIVIMMIKINRKFGRMAMKKCLILISLFFVSQLISIAG